ncbi:TolC family protein, partial [uncultured Helicobacter sp.]
LPWVSYTLSQSYQNKILRQEKSYELTKRLALISAKRLYLDYLVLNEQHQIYTTRYENAKNQLKISQVQYEAGRISKAQYLFFKSDFLSTKVALKTSYTEMLNTLNALKVILGITTQDSDLHINGLDFAFLHSIDTPYLEKNLKENLYLDIIALDIKDYQYSAKIASQSRFDSFEIGGGINTSETSNGVVFKIKVPLPLTTKYGNQKAMYLALQSGAIRESEILKDSLLMNAKSYLEQLDVKQEIIALAKDDENNRAELSETSRIGYEAGKISAFEYLSVKNEHLDAMIATTQAKRDYISTLAKLEETLSSVLNLPLTSSTKEKS